MPMLPLSHLDASSPLQPTLPPSESQEKEAFAWDMDIQGFSSLCDFVAAGAPSASTEELCAAF